MVESRVAGSHRPASSSVRRDPGQHSARAAVLEGARRLVQREIVLPEVGDDDGLMKVEACGLCGTDHEQYSGLLPLGVPFIPGHESVGVIEAVGQSASERWGVKVGDRVAVEVFQSCRECDACSRGDYRLCKQHGIGDMYGFVPVDKSPCLWGGYATHQYLSPDCKLLRVPDTLDPVTATMFNPLGAGIRWGAMLPGTKADDVVAILGPGIRGISALVAAREAGAQFVAVTGFGPRDAARLDTAENFGADLTVDVAEADPVQALRKATGGLADIVVDVTAKAPHAFAQALALARPGGTVVIAGTRGTGPTPEFRSDDLVYKELRVLGALGVDTASYETAFELLASRRYPFEQLPRKVVSLDGLPDLLESLSGEGGRGRSREERPMHAVVVP